MRQGPSVADLSFLAEELMSSAMSDSFEYISYPTELLQADSSK